MRLRWVNWTELERRKESLGKNVFNFNIEFTLSWNNITDEPLHNGHLNSGQKKVTVKERWTLREGGSQSGVIRRLFFFFFFQRCEIFALKSLFCR